MDLAQAIVVGFSTALSWSNLTYCFIGVFVGTAVGVLPGLGPVATISLLLPFSFTMDIASALILMAGVFYGAQYGGSITAILVRIPGEASAVVTCIDGYAMARQGRAGAALGIAAFGSFIAGVLVTIALFLVGPALANVALAFGPAEYTALVLLGFSPLFPAKFVYWDDRQTIAANPSLNPVTVESVLGEGSVFRAVLPITMVQGG